VSLLLLFATFFAAVVVQGQLAAGQERLDTLNGDLTSEVNRHERLRRQVSELESPAIVDLAAQNSDMVRARPRAHLVPVGSSAEPGLEGRDRLPPPGPGEVLSEPALPVAPPLPVVPVDSGNDTSDDAELPERLATQADGASDGATEAAQAPPAVPSQESVDAAPTATPEGPATPATVPVRNVPTQDGGGNG
jgi:hypothetical protein